MSEDDDWAIVATIVHDNETRKQREEEDAQNNKRAYGSGGASVEADDLPWTPREWFSYIAALLIFNFTVPLSILVPHIKGWSLWKASSIAEEQHRQVEGARTEELKREWQKQNEHRKLPHITDQTKKARVTVKQSGVAFYSDRSATPYHFTLDKDREVEILEYPKHGNLYCPDKEGYVCFLSGNVKIRIRAPGRSNEMVKGIIDIQYLTPAPGDPTYKKPQQQSSLLRDQKRFEQRRLARAPQNADRNRMMRLSQRGAVARNGKACG